MVGGSWFTNKMGFRIGDDIDQNKMIYMISLWLIVVHCD